MNLSESMRNDIEATRYVISGSIATLTSHTRASRKPRKMCLLIMLADGSNLKSDIKFRCPPIQANSTSESVEV